MSKKIVRGIPFTVIGDPPLSLFSIIRGSPTQRIAITRRKEYTHAEKRLEEILKSLNNGVLKGKFHRQWTFGGKWILDFFFYENRLGIEIDGCYHQSEKQRTKDKEKEEACYKFEITLIRLTNKEVSGDENILINKLRDGWRKANQKKKNKIIVTHSLTKK